MSGVHPVLDTNDRNLKCSPLKADVDLNNGQSISFPRLNCGRLFGSSGDFNFLFYRRVSIWEPLDQTHISFQMHLPVTSDVNNVTLSRAPPPSATPLSISSIASRCLSGSAMTQVWEVINRLAVWLNESWCLVCTLLIALTMTDYGAASESN